VITVSETAPRAQPVLDHGTRWRTRLLGRSSRRAHGRWRLRRTCTVALVYAGVFAACAGVAPAAAAPARVLPVRPVGALSLLAPTAQPPSRAGRWLWPIASPHPITQGYEAPATRYSAGHRGIDITAQPGSAVFAPADGIVHFAGVVVDRPVLTLEIAGDLLATGEPVESSLAVGTAVHAGDAIGIVASGGHCSGTCLHFGVRLNGEYVSPMLYLGGVDRAVLLPMR
jgi:murein DD-endopeptidase MepM/ murein hydrolase activator NlpD